MPYHYKLGNHLYCSQHITELGDTEFKLMMRKSHYLLQLKPNKTSKFKLHTYPYMYTKLSSIYIWKIIFLILQNFHKTMSDLSWEYAKDILVKNTISEGSELAILFNINAIYYSICMYCICAIM